jgi:hypothetical protein
MMPEEENIANSTSTPVSPSDPSADSSKKEEEKKEVTDSTPTPDTEHGSIFNIKKPKDMRDGFFNGTANILKG